MHFLALDRQAAYSRISAIGHFISRRAHFLKPFAYSGLMKSEGGQFYVWRADRLLQTHISLQTTHINLFTQPGCLQPLIYRPRRAHCLCISSEDKQNDAAFRRTRNIDHMLMVAEGICIVGAITSQTACLLTSVTSQNRHISTSAGETPALFRYMRFSTWQVLPLWIALVINAILRARQSAVLLSFVTSGDNLEPNYLQRVKKLEDDLGSGLTIMRALARQFEKLGVRFRVTRRTLRGPIEEATLLTQKTSEVVKALIQRNDTMEKEMKNIQSILLLMQEQQAKQLELISKVVKTTSKAHKPFHAQNLAHEKLVIPHNELASSDKTVKGTIKKGVGGLQKVVQEKSEDL